MELELGATSDEATVTASVPMPQRASWHPNVPAVRSYLRSQLSAGLATGVDFIVMVACVELLALWYVLGSGIGAFAGGLTAFIMNRHWSFLANHGQFNAQAARYAAVWTGSLGLNCLLVYLLTDHAGLQYTLSKAAAAVAVGTSFNFPLHRFYVFR